MSVAARGHDTAVLLRTEHAVGRVLTEAHDEAAAYPRLLAAIGESLGWDAGGAWTPQADILRCTATWHAPEPFERISRSVSLARGEGLPGRVWASGEPAWITDVGGDANFPRASLALDAGLRAAFCFPVRGAGGVLAAIEFLAREPRDPDATLLATMTSLGGRIGQCVERWRAEDRLRESDARKSAILNAAFDCVITMDAAGLVVEVNRATEETFGYRAEEMVGRELADLVIPPALRDPHRRGVERYVATGEGEMVGHPVELPAMRADGSEFPVEIAITRPEVPGPPLFTGFLRDITERKRSEQALRALADEQAALRRVATIVAGEAPEERVFAVVTEEVGRLLGAHTANMVRFEADGTALVLGGWSTGSLRSVPVGTRASLGRRRADQAGGPALGGGDRVDRPGQPVPSRRRAADRRLHGAGRAGAGQRGGAAGAGGVARADRGDRRRGAPAARAQPARRSAAAARHARAHAAAVRAAAGGRGRRRARAPAAGRRRAGRRARGAARAGARHPPGDLDRARAGRGARDAGRALRDPGRPVGRARGPAAGAGRGGRLLHRRRGADECDEARRRHARPRRRAAA